MTVAELLEHLKQYPPDAIIYIPDGYGDPSEVVEVFVSKGGKFNPPEGAVCIFGVQV